MEIHWGTKLEVSLGKNNTYSIPHPNPFVWCGVV
jgi:hypothetical protein